MTTSILEQELAPIEAQIEIIRPQKEALEADLRLVEEELNSFSAERERFEALRDVCNTLDKLEELKAGELFWGGIPEVKDPAEFVEKLRSGVTRFEEEISGFMEKQRSLQEKINRYQFELDILFEEIRDCHEREERRKEEYVVVRKVSPVPYREMVMPWTKNDEGEKYFRRAILLALLISFIFGFLIPMINVPVPDRSTEVVEIPERLVKLVKKEKPKPEPEKKVQEKAKEEQKEEEKKKPEEEKPEVKPEEVKPVEEMPKVAAEKEAARKKAESVGVLKFKNALADLIDDTPARIGTESNLTNDKTLVKGQAVPAQRSLVSMQVEGGSSGGISSVGISRNVGNSNVNRLGSGGSGNGAGFARVESSIADLEEASRPAGDGFPSGRTDEEIQIVFDRYKAALYRIYNKELRKNPTLRGKILMRISIEPNGEVSLCEVESTDLASPELVAKIIERVKRFNFGPKEDVPKITILYPIDFLPAG